MNFYPSKYQYWFGVCYFLAMASPRTQIISANIVNLNSNLKEQESARETIPTWGEGGMSFSLGSTDLDDMNHMISTFQTTIINLYTLL